MRKIALVVAVTFLAACGGSSSSTPAGTGYLRVANLSPDLGALDFCVAASGTTTFTGPVMAAAGAASGLVAAADGSKAVSKYFAYTAGTYDVRVIASVSGATYSTPLLTATGVSLGDGVYKLVAAVGATGVTGAPHALVSFTDEATVASNRVAIRFVNAGLLQIPPSAPSPLPGLNIGFTIGTVYTGVFTNVAYPGKGPAGGLVDANGYATVDPTGLAAGTKITSCLYPDVPPAVTCASLPLPTGYSITGGTVSSAYVIGYAGVPPNALLCGDNAPPPVAGYAYTPCLVPAP